MLDEVVNASNLLPLNQVVPDDVRKALLALSQTVSPIIVIDEFDRLDDRTKAVFADLIKSLSDHSVQATIILIGVGESVESIIKEHESVSRALVQINMPRMNAEEIKEILNKNLKILGMSIETDVLNDMAALSKGLPHYAHLIGKHSARAAVEANSLHITDEHFKKALEKAINEAQHSIRASYHDATRSTKKVSLFSEVILACALAPVNEMGEFAAQDIRYPMAQITGKNYTIPAFARHLDEFASDKRGNILIKTGMRKLFRYKFKDPLMQSYVIMQGIKDGKITSPI